MERHNIYSDIAKRTDGNIYIGVVGPVRTGKSTFIKRFMDLMVIPHIDNDYSKTSVIDQLPQSGDGKTIYTTEPKFVPNEAALIKTNDNMTCKVKMIDCVGYLIPGISGHQENGKERMVKTPWDDEEIPFRKSAEIGTDKVIREHSSVAVVVTTDGTIGEIPREAYLDAEDKTIRQLKGLSKPFVIVVNTVNPSGSAAANICRQLYDKHNVPVIPANCAKMNEDTIVKILEKLLYQFPATEINFDLPGYLDALDHNHWIKKSIIDTICNWMENFETVGDIQGTIEEIASNELVSNLEIEELDLSTGCVQVKLQLNQGLYYKVIEEIMQHSIESDAELFEMLQEYAEAKIAYDNLKGALEQVDRMGYGIVQPKLAEMKLNEPEIFKQGNKYGVRLVATAPCLHIIKTEISTEVSPIVGTEGQSQDLAKYLNTEFDEDLDKVWRTNLFGKSIQEMVTEQMDSKLANVPGAVRGKVQKSLQKISDEGRDYFICIII